MARSAKERGFLATRSGASTRELMHRMDHSSMRAALIYQHATDASTDAIARRIDELLKRERKVTKKGRPDTSKRAAWLHVRCTTGDGDLVVDVPRSRKRLLTCTDVVERATRIELA